MATHFERWRKIGLTAGIVIGVVGCLACAFCFLYVLLPKDVAKMDAAELFEGFVCRPIPPSVKNMTAQGRFAFAGSHAVIDFSIKSEDLPALLSGADLAPAEQGTSSGHPPWTNSSHLIFEKTGKGFDPGNWLFLHVDTNRWLCRIYFGSL